MKIYIIHRDVDYEFGQVVEVYGSSEKAEQELTKILEDRHAKGDTRNDYEFSIQEFEIVE